MSQKEKRQKQVKRIEKTLKKNGIKNVTNTIAQEVLAHIMGAKSYDELVANCDNKTEPEQKPWTLIMSSTDYGIDVLNYDSEDAAITYLANCCRDWWNQLEENDGFDEPPEDDNDAIGIYYSNKYGEHYELMQGTLSYPPKVAPV